MRMRFSVVICLLFFAIAGWQPALGQDLRENQPAEKAASATESALRTAASQYEIIDVLMAEGHFSETVTEFEVIVNLGLEGDQEILVARAAWDFAVVLREAGQYEVAHQIIDLALRVAVGAESRYSLLMMRGKVFKDQHRYDLAIKALREAQLLGVPPKPGVPPPGSEGSGQKQRLPQ